MYKSVYPVKKFQVFVTAGQAYYGRKMEKSVMEEEKF
jgi:hypothetical protein